MALREGRKGTVSSLLGPKSWSPPTLDVGHSKVFWDALTYPSFVLFPTGPGDLVQQAAPAS